MLRKPAFENVVCLCRLLIFLQTFQTYFSIQANSVDRDQTAPKGADMGPHCLHKWLLKSQADDKADNNCCDWWFKGKEKSLSRHRVKTEDEFPTVWVHTLNAFKEISRQQSCDMHKKIFGEIKTTFNLNSLHRRLEDNSHELLPCFLKKTKKTNKNKKMWSAIFLNWAF